jgi:hypothetical protein
MCSKIMSLGVKCGSKQPIYGHLKQGEHYDINNDLRRKGEGMKEQLLIEKLIFSVVIAAAVFGIYIAKNTDSWNTAKEKANVEKLLRVSPEEKQLIAKGQLSAPQRDEWFFREWEIIREQKIINLQLQNIRLQQQILVKEQP